MREILNDDKGGWVEVTDGDWVDEIAYIVNELKSIKGCLIRIGNELEALYEQNKPKFYIEGTNKEVKNT